MRVTLLHTAEAHRARFDALRDRMAPDVTLTHEVRDGWLAAAQEGVSEALAREVQEWVRAQEGTVLCTCTTLGAVAEAAGAVRIDRPLMEAAARLGGPVVMAYCLDSTLVPSRTVLQEAMGPGADIRPLPLAQHWALFEAGDVAGFEMALAGSIRAADPVTGCVVLAQASMAGAADHLGDLAVPVLASPELALRAVLDRAGLQNG